ncbi:MAG: hypothetical protein N2578_07145 [Bdellovibrionaceae bacterium]|nr:hypothetical protein [Pseudobdellovibrionaceae bacterium]
MVRSCPGVREVAVIGVPDAKWGEAGKAFVVVEKPEITAQALFSWCAERLAKFKIPREFVFLPELPKGDSGKILKKNLR